MRARLPAALVILGTVMATASIVRAERVALIRPDEHDARLVDAFNRLRAELVIHHFQAEVVDARVSEAPSDRLAEIAQEADAVASIAFLHRGSKASVDVWLVDRITGKTTMRRLEVGRTRDASSLLAIRAVDLLRVSLQELEAEERPPADVVGVVRGPVPPAARALAAPPGPVLKLRAEGMALFDGPELGFALGPSIGIHRVLGPLELGVMLAGPLVGGKYRARRGSASTTQELALVDARLSAARYRRLDAGFDVSFGAHLMQADGQADAPLISRSDGIWGWAAAVGVHAQLGLSRATAIGISLRALALLPAEGVAVAEERAELVLPLIAASVGIVVGL